MTSHLIDSLPYFENDYNETNLKQKVNSLIKEEMFKIKNEENFSIINYISEYPKLNYFEKCSETLKNEILKKSENEKIDVIKKSGNTNINYEYEDNKSINLQLLNEYGTLSWKKYTQALTNSAKGYFFSLILGFQKNLT
jgi:hypothetical protein